MGDMPDLDTARPEVQDSARRLLQRVLAADEARAAFQMLTREPIISTVDDQRAALDAWQATDTLKLEEQLRLADLLGIKPQDLHTAASTVFAHPNPIVGTSRQLIYRAG